jgi:hypothetical protein
MAWGTDHTVSSTADALLADDHGHQSSEAPSLDITPAPNQFRRARDP